MPLTLKTINAELAKRGHNSRLMRGDGYFYFVGGEAAEWLHKTVRVPNLSGRSLEQWMLEFEALKKLNGVIMNAGKPRNRLKNK